MKLKEFLLSLCFCLFIFSSLAQSAVGDINELAPQFTPNGDGFNENWGVDLIDVEDVDVKVYSRWGVLLFNGANGTLWYGYDLKGKRCPQGVYIYVIKIVKNGKQSVVKGSVEIIL